LSQSTFPNYDDSPARFEQFRRLTTITSHISLEFRMPECPTALWSVSQLASRVAMPEASMNEYDCPISREDNIRSAGETMAMQPEPDTHAM
jgi:hypothetical protein